MGRGRLQGKAALQTLISFRYLRALFLLRKRFMLHLPCFFSRLFLSCSVLLVLSSLCGCHSNDNDEPSPSQKARRTVLIYMVAQNSLGYGGNLRKDSVEIMAARQSVSKDDRLLVFIDDNRPPRIYEVRQRNEKPRLVKAWAEDVVSTSPQTLQQTLTWMKENYPAEEYGLVMWSHADGWLPPTNQDYSAARKAPLVQPFSFGIDDGPDYGSDRGSQMDIGDMAAAIAAAGIRTKYIMFDACLMQNLEVAYALRNVADYVVAGPVLFPAAGANYQHLVAEGLFSDAPAAIVATYHSDVSDPSQSGSYADFGIVISCLRTEALQPLADALREALPHSTLVGRQSPDMTGVAHYQAYSKSYYYRPHNYDAAQAFERILPPEHREKVLSALAAVVADKRATPSFWIGPGFWSYANVDLDNYCAVSAFIPQAQYISHAADCAWGDLNTQFAQTEWYSAAGFAQTGW